LKAWLFFRKLKYFGVLRSGDEGFGLVDLTMIDADEGV
jgi:hypothetical protein